MIKKIIIITYIYLFLSSKYAHAYLDPGTGSIIIQAIIGVFLAGTLTFKAWSRKLKNFIQKIKGPKNQKDEK